MEQVQLVELEGWQEWQVLYLQVYVLGRLFLLLAEAAQADNFVGRHIIPFIKGKWLTANSLSFLLRLRGVSEMLQNLA